MQTTAKPHRHNVKRAERFRTKPIAWLRQVAESGSLASAAAQYELNRRERAEA